MHDANGASCLAAIRTWLEVVRSEEHSSTWIKQYPRFSKCWLNWYLEACRIWVNLEDLFPSINSVETYLLPVDDLLPSNSIQLFLPNLLQFGLHVREGVRVEFELNLSFWNSDISLVWKLFLLLRHCWTRSSMASDLMRHRLRVRSLWVSSTRFDRELSWMTTSARGTENYLMFQMIW